MKASNRRNRQKLRNLTRATRFNSSLKKGRSIATHLIAADLDQDTVKGVSIALKGIARRIGMQPVKVDRTRNTVDGKGGRKTKLRIVHHFTAVQVQALLNVYKPRKKEYVAAKNALVNS